MNELKCQASSSNREHGGGCVALLHRVVRENESFAGSSGKQMSRRRQKYRILEGRQTHY
jgi:hypothetical protein